MAERFQLGVAHGFSRHEVDGEFTPLAPDSFAHLILAPSGMAALERAMIPFGQTAYGILLLDSFTRSRAKLPDPVAIVLFDRDYSLIGHFLELRGERSDVKCTYCSYRPDQPPPAYPPISLVYVPDWEIFATMARGSPLLAGAWSSLSDADHRKRWLCIADPLPEQWVATMEASDRKTFTRIRG